MTDGRKPLPPKPPPLPDFGDDEADGVLSNLTEFDSLDAPGDDAAKHPSTPPGATGAGESAPKTADAASAGKRPLPSPRATRPKPPLPSRPRAETAGTATASTPKLPSAPQGPGLPKTPAGPGKPALPRPGGLKLPKPRPKDAPAAGAAKKPALPRPGGSAPQRRAVALPRPGIASQERTATPPAVNPAGPARREPFPPTTSPRAPAVSSSEPPPSSTTDLNDVAPLPETLSQPPPPNPSASDVDLVLSRFEPRAPSVPSFDDELLGSSEEIAIGDRDTPPNLQAVPMPSEAPPLPSEAPPLPSEAPPLPDDADGVLDFEGEASDLFEEDESSRTQPEEDESSRTQPEDETDDGSAGVDSLLFEDEHALPAPGDDDIAETDLETFIESISDVPPPLAEREAPPLDEEPAPPLDDVVSLAEAPPPSDEGAVSVQDLDLATLDGAELALTDLEPQASDVPPPFAETETGEAPAVEVPANDPSLGAEIDAQEVDISSLGLDLFAAEVGADGVATELGPWRPPREDGEVPAAALLAEREATSEWHRRAEWAEAMAAGAEGRDADLCSRNWLLASELWAMLGDIARARVAARKATQVVPGFGLAQRQARMLAAAEADWKVAGAQLDGEARSAPTPEARAHAAFVSSRIRELMLDDPQNASRRLDLAQRAWAADPRPSLWRVGTDLAGNTEPPKATFATTPELEPLSAALRVVSRLRGAPPQSDDPPSPALALGDAQRSVQAGDLVGAANALEGLRGLEGVREGVLWLLASLTAPSGDTRTRAVGALRDLLDIDATASVRQTLAARALEVGDTESLSAALARGEDDPFSAVDKVALAALGAANPAAARDAITAMAADPETLPIAAAAARAAAPAVRIAVGQDPGRSRDALGRRLAAGAEPVDLVTMLETVPAGERDDALRDALALVAERRASSHAALARRVASWATSDPTGASTAAAALLAETAGDRQEATGYFEAGLDIPWFAETSVRALLPLADASDGATLLQRAAASLPEQDLGRGLLLYEAAVRAASSDPARAMSLARAAAGAAPNIPGIYRLGDQLARALGDADAMLDWLRLRREATTDPVARALDAVRESLLIAESNPARTRMLLDQAVAARPDDIGLRELYERLSPEASNERGRWREVVAEKLKDPDASASLLLEAALEYERSGALDDAARVAGEAAHRRAGALAEIAASRLAASSQGAAELSGQLLQRARQAESVEERRALYEELYALDVARDSASTATMWHRTILEESPEHLPSLRALEHAYIGEGRDEDLEQIAALLTRTGDLAESVAHGALAARIRTRTEKTRARRDLVNATLTRAPHALWALRDLAALGEADTEPEAIHTAYARLIERGLDGLDLAASCLRAAEAAAQLGDAEGALALLDRALEAAPDYATARASRAELREQGGDPVGAAEDLETLAEGAASPELVADARKRAGALLLDHTDDVARAVADLEAAAAITPDDDEIFDKLQLAHVRAGDRTKLANLLQQRLESTSDAEQRIALEVSRGKALADLGDIAAARQALDAALESNPEHTDALEVYANLCETDGDYVGAERAWIRLARAYTEPMDHVKVYRRLGELYTTHIDNVQRAERCFREVLKHDPADESSMERLVSIYAKLGDAKKAASMQVQLIERAGSSELKRDRILRLAEVLDATGDKKSAVATLEKARKAWPQDDVVLRKTAEFHLAHGEGPAAKILLDRAVNEARRALSSGRFDASLFSTLVTVATLRGGQDAARVASATLAALEGRSEPVPGAGTAAGAQQLDDLLAPQVLSPALRALLKKLAGVLDAAYPVDIRALKAAPPSAGASNFVQAIRGVASKLGIQGLDVLVSPTMYATWLPASSTPPRLIVGQALLDAHDDGAQKFALFKSLKIVQSHGAAIARLSPVDLGPVMAALLMTFAKGWQPQGVDATKLAEAKKLIEGAVLPRVDDDVPTLALEVAGSLGTRASQLGAAFLELGNRAALLATGDPGAGFRALSLAGNPDAAIPAEGPERLKWVVKHPEARDIAVFSVSDAYAEARQIAESKR